MNRYSFRQLPEVKGVFAAFFMSFATFALLLILPSNEIINLLCVIIVPFVIAFIYLQNVMYAVTLTWLNEMIFGVGGAWLKFGPIPGRGVLLLIVLFSYMLANPGFIYQKKISKRDLWIVFYGILLPGMLLGYSVLFKGNGFSGAMSDVQRFLIILIYFPVRDLVHRHFSFIFGWISCSIATLSFLFILLAVAPEGFKTVLLNKWLFNFAGMDDAMTALVLQTGRAAFTPLILCMIGVFLGVISIVDVKKNTLKWTGIALLLSLASGAFVVNFLRGPIISMLIVFIVLAKIFSGFSGNQISRSFKFVVVFNIIILLGYFTTVTYFPTALTKWSGSGLTLEESVKPVRIEQTEVMLHAWIKEPIFGQGVGSPIYGYQRDESGLSFEVQYPMVLYRTGIVGFCFILAPFLWALVRVRRRIKQNPELISTGEGKLFLAMGCSIGALMITSWVNPYFASSMTFIFVLLFLAVDSTLPTIRLRYSHISI